MRPRHSYYSRPLIRRKRNVNRSRANNPRNRYTCQRNGTAGTIKRCFKSSSPRNNNRYRNVTNSNDRCSSRRGCATSIRVVNNARRDVSRYRTRHANRYRYLAPPTIRSARNRGNRSCVNSANCSSIRRCIQGAMANDRRSFLNMIRSSISATPLLRCYRGSSSGRGITRE